MPCKYKVSVKSLLLHKVNTVPLFPNSSVSIFQSHRLQSHPSTLQGDDDGDAICIYRYNFIKAYGENLCVPL